MLPTSPSDDPNAAGPSVTPRAGTLRVEKQGACAVLAGGQKSSKRRKTTNALERGVIGVNNLTGDAAKAAGVALLMLQHDTEQLAKTDGNNTGSQMEK